MSEIILFERQRIDLIETICKVIHDYTRVSAPSEASYLVGWVSL